MVTPYNIVRVLEILEQILKMKLIDLWSALSWQVKCILRRFVVYGACLCGDVSVEISPELVASGMYISDYIIYSESAEECEDMGK